MTRLSDILLKLDKLSKAYPGVIANDSVSFDIRKGEVHALLGENGAGKSTLVKMIYGLVTPDSGTMELRGAPFAPSEPRFARAAGIGMVFQHFSLFDALNVAENVALGMEKPPAMRALAKQISDVSYEYGLPLDPARKLGDLSAGERQRVEIIRCLLQEPKLLIMDEPTSVLTPQEVGILFDTLRKLTREGVAILYISHKLDEIQTLGDRATILRQGRVVAHCRPSETTARDMAEQMVGSSFKAPTRQKRQIGETLLSVHDLSIASTSTFGTGLKNIAFSLRSGEVLGIGGVAGNGQDDLLAVLSGERLCPADKVRIKGVPAGRKNPNERRQAGLLCAPEERLGHAAAPAMSLIENTLLTAAKREHLCANGFVKPRETKSLTQKIIKQFDVRTPSAETTAASLSGGNLQKFVIGRELVQNPEIFVVNQPTWGVDAAAAAAIRQALLNLTQSGAAVLIISQDLDELMEVSDRFGALNSGRLSALKPVEDLSVDEIGMMMGGADA